MKLKSENGFTGIDITVAIILVLLFMSLISVLLFNITKSSKSIERESEATYIATAVIEAFKTKNYNDIKITNEVDIFNYLDNNNNQIIPVKNSGENNFNDDRILIQPGYTTKVIVSNYSPDNENADLVKLVTVRVEYKIATEIKRIEFNTSVVRK